MRGTGVRHDRPQRAPLHGVRGGATRLYPAGEPVHPARFVYIAETDDRARKEAEEHLDYFYNHLYGSSFRSAAVRAVGDPEYREENAFAYQNAMPEEGRRAENFDFDEYRVSGEIIVGGGADSVASEIHRQYDQLGGFGMLIGLFQFGSLPDDLTRKNRRLSAERVMPKLEGRSTGLERAS